MRRFLIAALFIILSTGVACERVEKGMEGKKQAEALKEQTLDAQKKVRDLEKQMQSVEEKKAEQNR